MSSLDAIKKELGSLITKRIMTALGARPAGRASEEGISSPNGSAWKEIEHKLGDLFSHDEFGGRPLSNRDQTLAAAAGGALLLLVVAYLLGHWRGKRRSTILEVHKA